MKRVILDTNIYVRAAALQMEDEESVFLNSSRHDRDSSPEGTHGAMSARQCRALISAQLSGGNQVLVPFQQALELQKVIRKMREAGALGQHNEVLLGCVERFVRETSAGNRVPIYNRTIKEQYDVLRESLSIASSMANLGGNNPRQSQARRFMEKNEGFLVRALPTPNIELLLYGQRPFVWLDWLLCNAARRTGTIVLTMDRDFDILSDAYQRVTGYMPAEYIGYYPNAQDVEEFRGCLRKSTVPDVG